MEMDWRWNPIEIGFRNQSTRTERNCSRSPIIRPDWGNGGGFGRSTVEGGRAQHGR